MAKAQTNFDIDQGSDFRFDVELLDVNGDPVDLSAALIIGQVRKKISSRDIDATFTIEPVDLAQGKFALILSATTTSSLKCDLSNNAFRTITHFAYDVEVHQDDGTITRILEGVLNVSPEVTR